MTPALTSEQVCETGLFIAHLQGDDGALPWFVGGQWDAWNHTEALMGLTIAAHVSRETGSPRVNHTAEQLSERARLGLQHLRETQREDGSWPMRVRDGVVEQDESDTNQCAYPAVGVWHLALVTGAGRGDGPDRGILAENWPMVRAAIRHVLTAQRDDGTIAWAINRRGGLGDHALLTGNASILQSLWAAAAIADTLGHIDDAASWRESGTRLAAAVRQVELFADRRRFSMDWFYPVLGGALVGDHAATHLRRDWDRFVIEGQGVRCVDDRPWVTGGESAELVMALCCLDGTPHEDRARREARAVFADLQHTRDTSGGYWTGYVVDDDAVWPVEQTGWSAGAMLLAADALDGLTPAANFFHAMTWPARTPSHSAARDHEEPR
ncbi:prenyltransferase [Dermacoccus nishinomiyaensis]|uniref:prenyltransferase n=1 Tax=Dermacoccus nishinomiyaensis TaxID=1274 RepID=UPI00289F6CE3|nr:prenyltransferase [Dermacoccus nishinomiyaensis]